MSKANSSHMPPQPIRVPPMKPHKVSFWFTIFERQLKAAGIEQDADKVATLLGCLDSEYLERLEDVDCDSSAGSEYDRLKEELIRSLAESDSEWVQRLVEKEVMGDRKPSQFYHDLKKLASPLASDQFILTLWKNRLPDRIRRVLAVIDDTNIDKIIQAADRVEEACSGKDQREVGVAAVSKREAQDDAAPRSPKEPTTSVDRKMKEQTLCTLLLHLTLCTSVAAQNRMNL